MRFTPSTNWTIAENSQSKLIEWKIYARKVSAIDESLTGGTSFTDITEYVKDLPSISQKIELDFGQFTSDGFSLNCNNIDYWLDNWLNIDTWYEENTWDSVNNTWDSGGDLIEVKITMNIGVSTTLTSDTPILASGFIDKMSWEINELNDEISFNVESYDEYANRLSGKLLTIQPIDASIDGSINSGLITNISGIYIVEATKYLTTQTLEYNTSKQIKYNGGEFYDITTTGLLTLLDERNNKCIIYVIYHLLEDSSAIEKFVFKNNSDTNPYLYYNDATISELLTAISNELPVVSSSVTLPTFNLYNSEYRLNCNENLTNVNLNGVPKCIVWSGSVFYFAQGGTLYSRTVGGSIEEIFQATDGYYIKKIWLDISGVIWVLLQGGSDENYLLGKYEIISENYTEIDSETLGTTNRYAHSNFHLTSTGIFYAGTDKQDVRWLSFADDLVYILINNINSSYVVQEAFAFYTTNYGYYAQVLDGSVYKFYKTSSTPQVINTDLAGLVKDAIVFDNGGTFNVYYQYEGLLYKYSSSNGTTATNTQLSTTITGYGLYKYGTKIYFYGNGSKSGSTYYPFGYIDTATDTITTLSNFDIKLNSDDYQVNAGALTYYPTTEAIVFFTNHGRFMQFAKSNTLRINKSWDTSEMNLRDCLNEICKIYNLAYIIRPNKSLLIFPRHNSSGVIQTTGNNITLDTSNLISINKKFGSFGRISKVKLSSEDYSVNYNGSAYNTFDASDEKIIEISSDLLQHSSGYTLRDMATYYYTFFSKELDVINFHYSKPSVQYEVMDGAEVNLSNTRTNITGNGIIQSQSINEDGSLNLEVLIG